MIELARAACRTCGGTGRVDRTEYDSACGEMNYAGSESCPDSVCRILREYKSDALAGDPGQLLRR